MLNLQSMIFKVEKKVFFIKVYFLLYNKRISYIKPAKFLNIYSGR